MRCEPGLRVNPGRRRVNLINLWKNHCLTSLLQNSSAEALQPWRLLNTEIEIATGYCPSNDTMYLVLN